MTKQFTKSFVLNGNVETLFNQAEKFVVAKGFTITSSQRPGTIIATRGTKVGSYISTKMDDQSTTLKVDLMQQGDQVHVSCNYNVYVVGLMSSSDRMFLESEVEQLKMSLLSVTNLEARNEALQPQAVASIRSQPEASKPFDYTVELEKLAKLRDKGIITDKEFNAKKKQLLGI